MIDYLLNLTLFEGFFLFYFLLIFSSYFLQALCSTFIIKSYLSRTKFFDPYDMLDGDYLPKIAVIAPAYNEGPVVIQAVKSLLGVQYYNYELVIVNDGSKDDTVQKMIDYFDLIPSEIIAYGSIDTKPVKALYRSSNEAFKNLVVIDKVNGRKADAVNVGINHSDAEYCLVVDVDCILENDALLRLVEPIMHQKKKRVVAVGGMIGATNESNIEYGTVTKFKIPDRLYSRIQIIEYLRSFVLSRPFWAKINGLLLISGALGLFDREIVNKVNGLTHDSIGEDMDLVMKIHGYCLENKIDYAIEYIPLPLCWTELPPTTKILSTQRNRWMRGTIECMDKFKKYAFNYKYGVVGLLSYPYWFLAELMAPVLEFIGFFAVIYFIAAGLINVKFAILIFFLSYSFSVLLSFYAVAVFGWNFDNYNEKKSYLKFLYGVMIEPFYYHPRMLSWALHGWYDKIFKTKKGWGEMTRAGFGRPSS